MDTIGCEPNNKQNIYKDHVISYTYKNVQFASCFFLHGMTESGLVCFSSTHQTRNSKNKTTKEQKMDGDEIGMHSCLLVLCIVNVYLSGVRNEASSTVAQYV